MTRNTNPLVIAAIVCMIPVLALNSSHGHTSSIVRGIFIGVGIVLMIASLRANNRTKKLDQ